jgi:tripartite-type tricarboxylate transporter receptor subunit TctC
MIRFLIILLFAGNALAQSYPSRPVRIIVPLGAGGFADVPARMLAPRLSTQMGGSFFV